MVAFDLVKRASDFKSTSSALSKFNAICGGLPPPFRRYGSWDAFLRDRSTHLDGTTSLVLFKMSNLSRSRIDLDHELLVEALAYDDGVAHLMVTRRRGATVALDLPRRPHAEPIHSVTFGAFYTDDEPYRSFLPEFVEHYSKLEADVPTTICVVWFGDRPCPVSEGGKVAVVEYPKKAFHEAAACNAMIRYAAGTHLFRLDGDTFLSKGDVKTIMSWVRKRPSHGVVNLKATPQTGPGILFGHRATMARNPYDETFPSPFYHVDTAHLLSYSRRGVVPTVVFLPAMRREDHDRPLSHIQQGNWPTLCRILAGEA